MIYVLTEHLRDAYYLLPFRMYLSIFMVLQEWLRQFKGKRKRDQPIHLPVVFPIVFYNGNHPYRGPLRLEELFEDAALFRRLINNPIMLIDTNTQKLKKSQGNIYSYTFQKVMGSISDRNLDQILLELNPEMEKMVKEVEGLEFVEGLFRYVYSSSDLDPDKIRLIARTLEEGGKIVTALQQDTKRIRKQLNEANRKFQKAEQETLEAKRKIQDIEQKALEAKRNAEQNTMRSALQMLQDGLNVETVAKYVNMPIEAIQKMAQQFGSSQSGLA